MNSKKMLRRFAIGHVACQIESLESRQMLATDLLISNYDDASGTSVYRYNDTTWNPAAGSVPAGDNDLSTAQGIAVAPDGSFFVSSTGSTPPAVYHYDVNGNYLGLLGAGDAVPAPIYFPAAYNLVRTASCTSRISARSQSCNSTCRAWGKRGSPPVPTFSTTLPRVSRSPTMSRTI